MAWQMGCGGKGQQMKGGMKGGGMQGMQGMAPAGGCMGKGGGAFSSPMQSGVPQMRPPAPGMVGGVRPNFGAPQVGQPGKGGAAAAAGPQPIVVSGCQNLTVANIIKGSYSPTGANHGKPVYKKDVVPGGVSVLIYFWDERDGPNFSGWWFGPKVGGDQVWAYNGKKAATAPPPNAWKVPWDGEVDPQLTLTYKQAGAVAPGGMAGMRPGMVGGPGAMGGQDPAAQGREAERKRMQEEAKKRQSEREQEQLKKQAELKKKREDEEQRRKEQAAALAVRKAIQKVRTATPENYDDLRAQLEEAQASNLEAMGSQAEKVSSEAEGALQQAQNRIDEVHQKRVEDDKKKVEAEKDKKEEEDKVVNFVKEATEKANAAQEKIKEAEEMAQKLEDLSTPGASPDSMVASAESTEKSIEATKEATVATRTSIMEMQKDMGDCEAFRKVKREIVDLTSKLASGLRNLEKLVSVVKSTREKAGRKANALKKEGERKANFVKYDKDKDGKLSQKEIEAYSKAAIDFQLTPDVLDKIMKSLEPVTFAKFRSLHQKVSIAKSEVLARTQRAEEEAKAKVIQEQRQAIQAVLDAVAELHKTVEATATEAEVKARPLVRDGELAADAIKELADALEVLVQSAEEGLSLASAKLKEAKDQCEANETLKGYDQKEAARCEQRETRTRSRVAKVNAAVKLAREKAMRKAFAEIDQKRTDCVTAIRAKMTEEAKTGEQCFEGINGGKPVAKDTFEAFLKGLAGLELGEGQAQKLFEHIASDATEISKARFLELVRLYYKCVKATVLSDEISIKGKTVRRLEVGEVLEALEGPAKEEGAGVQRIKCQAVQDDAIGWVTLAGNQGTPFLEPGGNFYTCVKETLLTDGLSVQDSKTVRRIAKGEVIEVLEFQKKDASADVKRIKGKAKLDGASGWITVSSNAGTSFLEPC